MVDVSSGMSTQRIAPTTHDQSGEGIPPFDVICEDTSAIPPEEWQELRRTGLGGSDVAAAMGLSPFTSRYALYLDKTGEGLPFTESEYMKWGKRLEDSIARAFEEETGFSVIDERVMLRSTTCSFALANIDRVTVDSDGPAIVEIKNVGKHKAHDWLEGPPLHYRLQGQWYLFVRGERRVYFAVLVGGQDFRVFLVERDDDLIAEMLRQAEAFWSLVQLRRPPDVDGSDSTASALKAQYATVEVEKIDGGVKLAGLLLRRQSAEAVFDTAKAQLQEVDNALVDLLGSAGEGTVDDVTVVRRPQHSRTTIDIAALKRDHPGVAREYSKTTIYRQFSFPKMKESK